MIQVDKILCILTDTVNYHAVNVSTISFIIDVNDVKLIPIHFYVLSLFVIFFYILSYFISILRYEFFCRLSYKSYFIHFFNYDIVYLL